MGIQGLGIRVPGLAFGDWVWGSGIGFWGFRFWFWGLGFRV